MMQAMHLVYKALQKVDVPKTLPDDMIPPSKRKDKTPKKVENKPEVTKLKKRDSRSSIKKDESLDDDAFDDLAKTSITLGNKSRKGSVNSEGKEEARSGANTPTKTTAPAVGWVVTPQTKSYCDKLFVKADTDQDGYLNGLEIKKIFVTSGLPQPTLAKIWWVHVWMF